MTLAISFSRFCSRYDPIHGPGTQRGAETIANPAGTLAVATAEFWGTFFLVLSVMASGGHLISVASTLAVIIYMFGSTSGGVFNPAVIIGLVTRGAKGCFDFLIYVVVEVLGALLAVVVCMTSFHADTAKKVHEGLAMEGEHISLVNFFRSRLLSVV